jgi:hypothetical protein
MVVHVRSITEIATAGSQEAKLGAGFRRVTLVTLPHFFAPMKKKQLHNHYCYDQPQVSDWVVLGYRRTVYAALLGGPMWLHNSFPLIRAFGTLTPQGGRPATGSQQCGLIEICEHLRST